MTDDCVHLRRTRHRLKGSGKCTQWRAVNFTRRPPKFAPCSPLKPKSIQLGEPLPYAQIPYSPFFSTTSPQPSPTHPASKPQICTVFLLPLPALKPHLFHLSFPTSLQTSIKHPTNIHLSSPHAARDVAPQRGLLTILVHFRLK